MNFFTERRRGDRRTRADDDASTRDDGDATRTAGDATRARRAGSASRRRAFVFAALAVVAWGAFAARAAQVFGPDSLYVQPFNSDSALPVLMANDRVVDPFRLYVYGQDQIGAFPFLFCQLLGRATGLVWTERSVYLLQVAWLFLGVLAVHALARRTRAVAPALFVAVLCLHPTVGHYVFVLNQRYSWQLTPLLFAWWTYRRLCARAFDATHATERRTRVRLSLLSLASFVFSLLAVWASPLSAPMLLCFLALEAARARAVTNEAAEGNGAADARDDDDSDGERANARAGELDHARSVVVRGALARLLACALPLAAAVFAERLIKAIYHRHALKHFGTDFHTPTQVDWGHLTENLRAQLAVLTSAPAWWLALPALAVAPFVAFALIRRVISRHGSGFTLTGARLDAAVLMLGSLAAASVNFASAFLFLWIRLNAYGGRYLALTHLFGAFAGLVALFLLATLHPRLYAARRVAFPAVAAACALLVAFKFPPRARNPEYENLRGVAAGLAARDPRAVILGGYWDTYVLAALRPRDHFTPVPAEDQLLRTPWTARSLAGAQRVVVVHHYFPYAGGMEVPGPYTTFGDGESPPPVIRQHGATLLLDTPRWYARGGYVFSLYRNAGDATGAR